VRCLAVDALAPGALRDFWTDLVAAQLTERAACVADQYAQYDAAPGIKVDGVSTLGENIADLGGVRAAFAAYRALGESEAFDGPFSAEQQFFLSYAQTWCSNIGPAAAATWATIDVHAPPQFRVNGVVSNMTEFAAAFGCAAGAPMVRSPRCEVW
jgi:putative endopeptidase